MTIVNGVYIEHGGADSNEFWDASFTREQLAYADITSDRRGISIVIDQTTGTVDLNAGYIPESPEGREEQSLWDEYRELVIEALDRRIDLGEGNDAFKRRAAEDREHRAERIIDILRTVEEHGEDA